MAFILPRSPIKSIRGRLGSISFQRHDAKLGLDAPDPPPENQYEPFGRGQPCRALTRPAPRPKRSAAQSRAALIARKTEKAWRELSDAERQTWVDAAEVLQLTQNEDTIGQLSAHAMFVASRARWLTAGAVGPDEATTIADVRIDRPWLLAYAGPTPGELHVFQDAITQPFPSNPALVLVYASPPRPVTRKSMRRNAVYRASWLFADRPNPGSPQLIEIEPWPAAGPGSIIEIKASMTDDDGETSNVQITTAQTAPEGFALAFIAWRFVSLVTESGIELGADRVLRVWSFDYPGGSPAELDLVNPSPKTIGDVRSFMNARSGWDIKTIDSSHNSAPASTIPCIKRQRWTFASGALSFFASTE